ncbi:MAG: hypothetical protein WC294_00060 [Methanoregula sp.]|jgi:hypothetical protein
MFETLLGGLLGGVFRCIPEVLKFFDAKDERKHELDMQDKAITFQKLKGDQAVTEIEARGQQEWNTGALDTLKEAIIGQSKLTGIAWIDAVSQTVRPVITYWFMALYCAAKAAVFYSAIQGGASWPDAIRLAWTSDDMAIWAGIINFWFLSRVFEKVK